MHYDKSERIPVATCGSRIYVQTYRVYKIKCPGIENRFQGGYFAK